MQKKLRNFCIIDPQPTQGVENPHVSDVKFKTNAIGIMLFEQHIS